MECFQINFSHNFLSEEAEDFSSFKSVTSELLRQLVGDVKSLKEDRAKVTHTHLFKDLSLRYLIWHILKIVIISSTFSNVCSEGCSKKMELRVPSRKF